jgi:hypothetical protein
MGNPCLPTITTDRTAGSNLSTRNVVIIFIISIGIVVFRDNQHLSVIFIIATSITSIANTWNKIRKVVAERKIRLQVISSYPHKHNCIYLIPLFTA